MRGSLCDTCGWAHINMPAILPPRVADFEQRRLEAARKAYAERQRSTQLSRELDDAKAKLSDATNRETQAQALAASMKTTHTQELSKLSAENADLSRRHQAEVQRLMSECAELREKLGKASAASSQSGPRPKGVVMITSEDSRTTCFMLVYEGRNTYGSRESSGMLHHQVTMGFRGLNFNAEHFAVETRGDRLVFHDLAGNIRQAASPIPSTGILTTPAMRFYLNDRFFVIVSML